MRIVVLLIAAALSALCQEPAPLSIKVDVKLVNVAFIVRDQTGALAANLAKDDVEVLEDGRPQEIRFFGRSADLPLRLALVIDVSGSQSKFNKRHLRDIRDFLGLAMTPRDRATLVRFGDHIRVVTDITPTPARFLDEIEELKSNRHYLELDADDTRDGGTALFDAICATAAMNEMQTETSERKAMILFSDGEDNSSAHDLIDAIENAQIADSPIYTVRYTETKGGRLTSRNRYGMREMERLAKETGGASFDASLEDVAKSLREVADELRSTYDLGYVSTNPAVAGYRKVEIRVKRPGLTVRARPGYYAR
jgi:Ca-activated chloride channel family protein